MAIRQLTNLFRSIIFFALLCYVLPSPAQQSYDKLVDTVANLMRNKNYVDAEMKGRKLVELVAKEKGSDSYDYLTAIDNLSLACRENHNYEESEPLLRKAITLREKLYGNPSVDYAGGLFSMGRLFFFKGELDTARTWYERAVDQKKLLSPETDFKRYPTFLENLAELYCRMKDFDKAMNTYGELLLIRKSETSLIGYIAALNGQGYCLMDMERPQEAIGNFKNVLELKERAYGPGNIEIASALNNLAMCEKKLLHYSAADSLLRVSISLSRTASGVQSVEYIACVASLTELLTEENKLAEVENLLKDLLADAGNNPALLKKVAATYAALGSTYSDKNKFTEGEGYYRKAISLYRRIGDTTSLEFASYLNNLGSTFIRTRQYDSAGIYLQLNYKIFKSQTNYKGVYYVQAIKNLGVYYQAIESYELAKQYMEESLRRLNSIPGEHELLLAELENTLAKLYVEQRDLSDAEPLLEKAVPVILKSSTTSNDLKMSALDNRAEFYYRMGRYELSEKDGLKSLELKRQYPFTEPYDYLVTFSLLGSIYKQTLNYSKAHQYLKAAVDTAYKSRDKEYPAFLGNLADCYRLEKKYDTALKLTREGVRTWKNNFPNENKNYATLVNNEAKLLRDIGRFTDAIPLYKQALTLWARTVGKDHPYYIAGLTNLAELYSKMKDYKNAETMLLETSNRTLNYISKNLSYLSETEKLEWIDHNNAIFSVFPNILEQDSDVSPAIQMAFFNLTIATRNLALSDEITKMKRLYLISDSRTRRNFDQWKQLREQVARLSFSALRTDKIVADSLEKVANRLEKELNLVAHSEQETSNISRVTFEQIKNSLATDEVAIEFLNYRIYDDGWKDSIRYGAFIIRRDLDFPCYVPICSEKEIIQLVTNDGAPQTDMVSVRKFYKSDRPAKLYHLIFAPFEPYLRSVKRLDLSMAGLLNNISVASLPTNKDTLVIDKFQVAIVTNLKLLINRQQQAPLMTDKTNIELVGDIEFGNSVVPTDYDKAIGHLPLAKLDGTREEIEQIATIASASHLKISKLTDSAATETSFKKFSGASPTIIHLATHCYFITAPHDKGNGIGQLKIGYVKENSPLFRSGLFLANCNTAWTEGSMITEGDDGILTSYEISQLDLSQTRLFVLSACESGLGDISGDEGVFGLQRSLKLAGVESMILSLWKVPDEETSQLMKYFYSELAKNNDLGEALNFAQKEMRKKYDPYYWAAFTLVN